ncbi:MAG TPA: hypothetical protein VEL47_06500 [Myxococcota bacterium]|nr:hypothetical protein [Myxococcota bacterium]
MRMGWVLACVVLMLSTIVEAGSGITREKKTSYAKLAKEAEQSPAEAKLPEEAVAQEEESTEESEEIAPSKIKLIYYSESEKYCKTCATEESFVLDIKVMNIENNAYLRLSTTEDPEIFIKVLSQAPEEGVRRLVEVIKQQSKSNLTEILATRRLEQFTLTKIVINGERLDITGIVEHLDETTNPKENEVIKPRSIMFCHQDKRHDDRQHFKLQSAVRHLSVSNHRNRAILRLSTEDIAEVFVHVLSDASGEGIIQLIDTIKRESKDKTVNIWAVSKPWEPESHFALKKIVVNNESLNIMGLVEQH